jgi:pyruvate formate lyase activating enzyme
MERDFMSASGNGSILDIQRMSTEDGPGLRTTVFLKGCNLECAWCHNPESIPFTKPVLWVENRCIGCRSCRNVCRSEALLSGTNGIEIDRSRCTSCLECVNVCPAGAMEARGTEWDACLLVKEVLKDRVYFEKSGGGITVSGGEALLQPDFLCDFMERLKKEGIHTALDTAGNVPFDLLERAVNYTDLILYDIKIVNPVIHKKYTGCDNKRILDNAARLALNIRNGSCRKEMWIRTPVIPDATSDDDNISAIGRFITHELKNTVAKWELCAFNNLCRDKYRRLGKDWLFRNTQLLTKERMEKIRDIAVKSGVPVEKVCWSGPTRVENNE